MTEIDHAIANAVRELRQNGGSEKDVRQLIGQFEIVADEANKITDSKIPD